ncbi:MAG: hypothetical protein JWL59_232 [Chthoniobacteraceae bacterium]|nr:hypothetical protein [Chthoniobacteraceae bacterium]
MNGKFAIFLQILDTSATSRLTLEAMKLFQHIITVVCVVASLVANAGEQLTANAKCAANQPTAGELQLLQGTWEGVLVGDDARQKITITINGNSLHFHRDTNFWFETTITLPAGKDPKQLHATIKGCPQPDSIGKLVAAIFKIEDGTLTLAEYDISDEPPKTFDGANRYVVKRVPPQKKNAEPPSEPKTPNPEVSFRRSAE